MAACLWGEEGKEEKLWSNYLDKKGPQLVNALLLGFHSWSFPVLLIFLEFTLNWSPASISTPLSHLQKPSPNEVVQLWHDWLEFFKWPFWVCFFFFYPLESYKESVYMNRFEKQSFLMSTLSQRFVRLPYLFKMNKNYITYFHNILTFLKYFSMC